MRGRLHPRPCHRASNTARGPAALAPRSPSSNQQLGKLRALALPFRRGPAKGAEARTRPHQCLWWQAHWGARPARTDHRGTPAAPPQTASVEARPGSHRARNAGLFSTEAAQHGPSQRPHLEPAAEPQIRCPPKQRPRRRRFASSTAPAAPATTQRWPVQHSPRHRRTPAQHALLHAAHPPTADPTRQDYWYYRARTNSATRGPTRFAAD